MRQQQDDLELLERKVDNRKVCCSVIFLVVLATLFISWILWFVLKEVGV